MQASLIAAALAVSAAPAPASRATPALVVALETVGPGANGTLFDITARCLTCPAAETGEPVVRGHARPGEVLRWDVAPGLWAVTAQAPDQWVRPMEVFVSADAEVEATVRAWPRQTVRGEIVVPTASDWKLPGSLVASIGFAGEGDGSFPFTEPCELDGIRWRCHVPATRLHLRLKPDGFVPRYFYGLDLSQGVDTDLGLLRLAQGSSVIGWVVDQQQRAVQAARVEVRTLDNEPIRGMSGSESDANGFFQVVVPRAATFTLLATRAHSSALSGPVEIGDNQEHRLREPLVLRAPLALEVMVRPRTDAAGRPWRMRLIRVEDREARVVVWDSALGADGIWRRSGLSPGTYKVTLLSPSGGPWVSRMIDLTTESSTFEISADPCVLRGRLWMGDEPLVGRVVFDTFRGPLSAEFATDPEGRFEGPVPCDAPFEEREWAVVVEAEEVRRTLFGVKIAAPSPGEFAVDLRVAATAVDVSVVDEEGRPFHEVALTLADYAHPERLQYARATGGIVAKTTIRGLDHGAYYVWARAGERSSDQVSFEITEKDPEADVRLTVRDERAVEGIVVTTDGRPVPGASLSPLPANTPPYRPVRHVVSGPSGTFRAVVPRGTTEVALTAWAHGLAFKIERVPLKSGEPVIVRMDGRGGTLNLEHEGPLASDHGAYVTRSGSFVGAEALRAWAKAHGQQDEAGRLTVPQMEPGRYSVCRAHATEAMPLLAGALPSGRCASGELAAGGELILRVPAAP